MTELMKRIACAVVVLVVGCGPAPVTDEDAGRSDAGAEIDAGSGDAGGADGGSIDAGADAGAPDAGDGGALTDGGEPDAGPVDAGLPDAGNGCPVGSGVGAPFRLRAMAANLSSGNGQSYDLGHGQRLMQAMQPDVVLIQEFNYLTNTATDFTTFANATLDGGTYFRGSGSLPNGVLSHYPILASGNWTDTAFPSPNRSFVWAHLDLPGPRDLWVVSVHLLTKDAPTRAAEAQALVAQLEAMVPKTDLLLLGGDFNTDVRSEAAVTVFSSRFVTTGPWPVDQAGIGGTNASRAKAYDWVLASPCLAANAAPVQLGTLQFPSGLVFDTRVFTPLSLVPPAEFGDSAAPSMQHMGVVRDFVIAP
jgi:hypothetical protein